MKPVQCSLIGLAIATINAPHMALLEQQGQDITNYRRLMRKQRSFLTGELKSEANLIRFFVAFSEWQQQQVFEDTLNDQIADLCCSALYASVEMLQDPECDDTELLFNYIRQIHDTMDDMGSDTGPLREYTSAFQTELLSQLESISQRPVGLAVFKWLDTLDTSLFGLAE